MRAVISPTQKCLISAWRIMSDTEKRKFILNVSCPETSGIVLAVSEFIFEHGATIIDAAQNRDRETDQFFMRVEFEEQARSLPEKGVLWEAFNAIASRFQMQFSLFDCSVPERILLAVSRHTHCLNDILHRWESGELPGEVVGVVSNHRDMEKMTDWYGLPYYYLPVTKENKTVQEAEISRIVDEQRVDLFALARYMQILSGSLCDKMAGRIINIHHSFLPGFKGANPYRQAYHRGVKVIGATAHYVTADLDEGPIIEQVVEKVDHGFGVEELMQIGRDAECTAFARALKWHCERRIIINGVRTVVFR